MGSEKFLETLRWNGVRKVLEMFTADDLVRHWKKREGDQKHGGSLPTHYAEAGDQRRRKRRVSRRGKKKRRKGCRPAGAGGVLDRGKWEAGEKTAGRGGGSRARRLCRWGVLET